MTLTLKETTVANVLRAALEAARERLPDDEVDAILRGYVGGCGHFDHEGNCQCENDE